MQEKQLSATENKGTLTLREKFCLKIQIGDITKLEELLAIHSNLSYILLHL